MNNTISLPRFVFNVITVVYEHVKFVLVVIALLVVIAFLGCYDLVS